MSSGTIQSREKAFQEIKGMCVATWEGEYRTVARTALRDVLQTQMRSWVDRALTDLQAQDVTDRHNGTFTRHLLTELGDLELAIPRTRTFSAITMLRQVGARLARRSGRVERMILLAFTLGLSTRKVATVLAPVLGEAVSPSTVSAVAKQLDTAVVAYHQRPLSDRYAVLVLDGVVLKHRTGVGAQRRIALVALGILPDGRREVIDFRQARSESQAEWEAFLTDLFRRGLTGTALKLIVADGGAGLWAALPLVYPQVPGQRCWAHTTRNVLNRVRRADQPAVKQAVQQISYAGTLRQAQQAAQQFVATWQTRYPNAARCVTRDLPELLTFLRVPVGLPATAVRTTNAIERRFREVKRRTRPMGTFSDRTSIDRILFAVFTHENSKEGTATPFLLTQNS